MKKYITYHTLIFNFLFINLSYAEDECDIKIDKIQSTIKDNVYSQKDGLDIPLKIFILKHGNLDIPKICPYFITFNLNKNGNMQATNKDNDTLSYSIFLNNQRYTFSDNEYRGLSPFAILPYEYSKDNLFHLIFPKKQSTKSLSYSDTIYITLHSGYPYSNSIVDRRELSLLISSKKK